MNAPPGFAIPVLREYYLYTSLAHSETELYDPERDSGVSQASGRATDAVAGDLLAVGWDPPNEGGARPGMLFLLLDPTLQRPVWVRGDQLA